MNCKKKRVKNRQMDLGSFHYPLSMRALLSSLWAVRLANLSSTSVMVQNSNKLTKRPRSTLDEYKTANIRKMVEMWKRQNMKPSKRETLEIRNRLRIYIYRNAEQKQIIVFCHHRRVDAGTRPPKFEAVETWKGQNTKPSRRETVEIRYRTKKTKQNRSREWPLTTAASMRALLSSFWAVSSASFSSMFVMAALSLKQMRKIQQDSTMTSTTQKAEWN